MSKYYALKDPVTNLYLTNYGFEKGKQPRLFTKKSHINMALINKRIEKSIAARLQVVEVEIDFDSCKTESILDAVNSKLRKWILSKADVVSIAQAKIHGWENET